MKKIGYLVHHTEVKEEQLNVFGTSLFHKDVNVKQMKNLGQCKVKGNVDSVKLINKGTISIEHCHVEFIKNVGTMRTNKIMAKTIHTSGNFQCNGDVTAELFHSKGTVNIKGNLVSNSILMEIGPLSYVQRMISTESIQIKASKLNIVSLVIKKLTVQQLEGKSIYLENINVQNVIGENVIVGPNCNIDKISYQKQISIHPKSKVSSILKEGNHKT